MVRGDDARRGRARVRRQGLRRLQGRRSPRRSSTTWRRSASATRSCAADEAALERGAQPRAPSGRARSPPDTLADVRDANGRRTARTKRPRRCALAALDLDLEVFQGPFDLLLTLVLQGGGRPARGRPRRGRARVRRAPRARGRARPRGGHRVPRPDRRAARAEVAADAAARGGGGARPRAAARRPRSCSRACSSTAATAAAAAFLRERLEAERGFRYRSAPLPPELRRVSVEAAERSYEPEQLAQGDRRPAAHCRRRLDLRHVAAPAVSVRAAAAPPARACCSRRGRVLVRRRRRGRRPPDRGRHPVRAARAVQGGRG